jgi:hypothetical protein
MTRLRALLLPLVVLCLAGTSPGQGPPPGPDRTIDAAQRAAIIEKALSELHRAYVFPEVAGKMEQVLRERLKAGAYEGLSSSIKFAETLTADLQGVSRDKHLRVRFSSQPLPERGPGPPSAEERERMKRQSARTNFGFAKAEVLAGNIGYLDLRGFAPPPIAAPTAVAAMNLLGNADALIVDLRQNGGGDPAMVALLCTYLFSADDPVHLNSLYWRPGDSTHQWWTLPYVPGPRFDGKPVYVLTSGRTFSGAEEFSYNLKARRRATIVGETTGGGAHPGGGVRLGDHFMMFVPSGRAINPVTKTNWEGTGVAPDIAVPAADAFNRAYLEALRKQLETAQEEGWKRLLKDKLAELEKPAQ